MRIGFDLTIASINQAGSGVYAQRLADALKLVADKDQVFFYSAGQHKDMSSRKTMRSRVDTLYRDLVWMHMRLPSRARRDHVDLLHLPAGILPQQPPCPTVLTIFDTTLFRLPEYFPAWQRLYFQMLAPRSARKANRILTISEQSKQDIIACFGVRQEKVDVTYPAAAPEFAPLPRDRTDEVRSRYGLGRFIFNVGTLEPRKNLVRLLEAFAILKKAGMPHQFVHAGPAGWLFEEVNRTVERLELKRSVRFLGRIPLADLVGLYNAADLFAYPSLYEGFGLPLLEAMSCGCPTVSSNVSSLPEVAGGASLLVDPYDEQALAEAMVRVLQEPELADRLIESGLYRAREFTWERCATETIRAYYKATGK